MDFQSTSPLDLSNESSISPPATFTSASLNFSDHFVSTTSLSSDISTPLETTNATLASNVTVHSVISRAVTSLDLTSLEFATRLSDSTSQTASESTTFLTSAVENANTTVELVLVASTTELHESPDTSQSLVTVYTPSSVSLALNNTQSTSFPEYSTQLIEEGRMSSSTALGSLVITTSIIVPSSTTLGTGAPTMSITSPDSLFILPTSIPLQVLTGNYSLTSTSTSVDPAIFAKEQLIPGFESVGPVQVLMQTLKLGLPSPDSETVYHLPQPYEKIQILVPAGAWMSPTSSRRTPEQIPELTATVLSLPNSTEFPGVPCGPVVLLGPHNMLLQNPIFVSVPCVEPRPSLGAGWEAVVHLYTQNTKVRASAGGGAWQREMRPQTLAYSNGTAWGEAHILGPNAAFWISGENSGTIGLVTGFVVGGALVAAVAVVGTWAVSHQLQLNKKRAQSVFPSFPLAEEVSVEDDSFNFVFRTERRRSRRRKTSRYRTENFSQPGSGHGGEASFVVDLSAWSGQDASASAVETSGGCTPPQFRPFPHHNLHLEHQPLWLVTSPLRRIEPPVIVAVEITRFADDHDANEISCEVVDEPDPISYICENQGSAQYKQERPDYAGPRESSNALASNPDVQSRKVQENYDTTQGRVIATAVSADVREAMTERRVIRIV
uniref:Uncharacterized protein n=1 Tax=Cryptomonas curvata TaxID=233186 RepID=A0A7S0QX51_9CRYP|mmetsp:Transcript_57254/g.119710  ORF Transcript_57254/g.119710 Transcript_57254/m.119710 type:complete len:666 (+) Transcript_57254:1-1998(+)